VEVFVADEQTQEPVDTIRWVRLAENVLRAEGVRGDAELSVLFVDEQAMTDLNKRFLGGESGRSPDSGGPGPGHVAPEPSEMPTLLGDVVICPAVARRNVESGVHRDRAATYDDEVALLLVHGILHLMGMDHVGDDEAAVMERRERDLLARFHTR
jgi:probable rRNA maturation factor